MPPILSDFWAPAGPCPSLGPGPAPALRATVLGVSLVLTVVELGGSNHVIDSLSSNDATEDLYHVVGNVLQIPAERLTLVVGTTVLPNVSGQRLHSLSLTSQSVVTAIRNAVPDDEVPDYESDYDYVSDYGPGCRFCGYMWCDCYGSDYDHDYDCPSGFPSPLKQHEAYGERMMANDEGLQMDLQMDLQEHEAWGVYDDKNHSFHTTSVQAVGFGATELLHRLCPMDPPRPCRQNSDLKDPGSCRSVHRRGRAGLEHVDVALDCYFRRMERFNWQPCDPRIMHLLAGAAPPFIAQVHGHDRLQTALTGRRGLDLKALQKNLCLRIIVKDEQILCWLSVDALPQVPIDCLKGPSDPRAPEGLAEQLLGKFRRSTSALQIEVNMACLQVYAAELEWYTPKHILRKFRNCSLSCQAELCVLLSMLCGFDEYDAYAEECDECECDDVCWDIWDALMMDPRHRTKTYLQDIFYEPDHMWHKFRESSSSCLLLLRDLCWCAVVPDEDRVWSRAYSSAPWDDHFRYYGCDECEEYDEYVEYDEYDVYDDTCWGVWDEPDLTDKDSEQVPAPLPRDPRRTMEIYAQDDKIKQAKRLVYLAAKDSFEKMKREQHKTQSQSCEKLKRGQHKVESRLSVHGGRHKVDPRLLVKGVDY